MRAEPAGHGAVPLAGAAGCARRALQTAEYGAEQRGDGKTAARSGARRRPGCRLRIAAHTDMHPVLLKPNSDTGAQVIIPGHAIGNRNARDYHDYKPIAREAVLQSHARLAARYQAIVAEGAGSPAEINLRANDIANMGFAEAVDCQIVLIADIDRGGVFAHLVGTLALLSASERERVAGFVINRFRGDLSLLQPGLDWLERETGKPVLGVLPYLHGLHLDAEDALPVSHSRTQAQEGNKLRVVVPVLRASAITRFRCIARTSASRVFFITPGEKLHAADLVILPGSKNVRADLDFCAHRAGKNICCTICAMAANSSASAAASRCWAGGCTTHTVWKELRAAARGCAGWTWKLPCSATNSCAIAAENWRYAMRR